MVRAVRAVLGVVVMDDGRLANGRTMEQELERRVDEIQAALVEQRQYTEFAFERLSSEMRKGFAQIDSRVEQIDSRFERIDSRFERIDSRFDRLERKLDQFIDTQSKTNELVERRLNALER